MAAGKDFFRKIAALSSREEYSKALREIERVKIASLETSLSSQDRTSFLLLISDVYYNNRLFKQANSYLLELESTYPDVICNVDFITLRFRLLLSEGETRKALEFIENALNKEWSEDKLNLINYHLGTYYFWSGDYLSAMHCFQGCYRYYITNNDNFMLGRVLYMLGSVSCRRYFYEDAESYFRKSLEQFNIARKNYHLGTTRRMLGMLACRAGMYDDASNNLLLASDFFKRCLNRFGMVSVRIELARVSILLGEYFKAEKLLSGAYRSSEGLGYKKGIARSALLFGIVYFETCEYKEAQRYLREAERLVVQLAPEGDISSEVYRRLGDLYLALGKLDEAGHVLSKAKKIAEDTDNRHELGAILRALGLLSAKKGNVDLARSYFIEAVATLRLMKESLELARTYYIIAELYEQWSESGSITGSYRKEVLGEARSYVNEAVRFCSSHGLDHRADGCKYLLRRIERESYGKTGNKRYRHVFFNKRWLHGGILVAKSKHMIDVAAKVRDFAPTTIPVLITGETGTGKEIVARLLHSQGDRAKSPFVAVNCASVPEPVFESELFGHKKGSFTGAVSDKAGLIEQASGGTLFLDEISELSSRQQAKLLRALQDGRIRRVGETGERPIDVRVISASNEDIRTILESERLRADFYYRISVAAIELKPLRKRKDDIQALFAYYLDKFGDAVEVEDGVIELFECYHWPGNVRELIGVVRVLALIGKQRGAIHTYDLPIRIRNYLPSKSRPDFDRGPEKRGEPDILSAYSRERDAESTRRLIISSIRKYRGNKSAVARELGISRSTLYRRIKELGIGEI